MSIFRRNAPSEFGSTVSITGTISADGVSSGSLDGGGSYIGLNSSNQFVLTAAGGSSAVTALNNATANELVTVGATITELDAESNLTFDGTTLQGSTLHVSASSFSAPNFLVDSMGPYRVRRSCATATSSQASPSSPAVESLRPPTLRTPSAHPQLHLLVAM